MSVMISNWYHARFYFFLFATLGLISPYLGWWLGSVVDAQSLKYILASFYATLVLIPAIWGHAAFSGQHPGRWLSHGALAAVVFALGLTQITPATPLGAACFLVMAFGVFFNPLLPLLEAMAYNQLADQQAYSRIRLYGSLGFMVCSSLVGGMVLMKHPNLFPAIVTILMAITWFFSLPYKNTKPLTTSLITDVTEMGEEPVEQVKTDRSVIKKIFSMWGLWLVTGLTQAAFACYFAFFALHMKDLGVAGWLVGLMIGVSAASEVIAFWKIKWFFDRASPWMLIAVASSLSCIRWVAVAMASDLWLPVVFALQLTQALGFSVFHTACLKIIHQSMPAKMMGAAQGFYNAVGYGVGGILGVFFSGLVWEHYRGQGVFAFAACISLSTMLIAFFMWHHHKNKTPSFKPS